MARRFLWSGQIEENCSNKVAWDTVYKPRDQGGLGLRNIALLNKVLLLKLVWRLHTAKDSLWVAWIISNKLKDECYWTYGYKDNDSWLWRSMISLRPLVRSFLRLKLGDGLHCRFWHDLWLRDHLFSALVNESTYFRSGLHTNITVSAAVKILELRQGFRRNRDTNLQNVLDILRTNDAPKLTTASDRWFWSNDYNNIKDFSTSYTWNSLIVQDIQVDWSKLVWFKGYIPRFAFTTWMAMLDKLPVRERLHHWGIAESPLCIFCGVVNESRDHLLLRCGTSDAVWRLVVHRLCGLDCSFIDWNTLMGWLGASTLGTPKLLKRLASQVTLNLLWKARNDKHFSQTNPVPQVIFAAIDRTMRDILLARQAKKHYRRLLQRWFLRT